MDRSPWGVGFGWLASLAVMGGLLWAPPPAGAEGNASLSRQALKILVSGVALYPDSVLKSVLHAASHGLHSPAGGAVRAYPEIAQVLNAHPALTHRLGVAYRRQPHDVWVAIHTVRAEVEARAGEPGRHPATDPAAAEAAAAALDTWMRNASALEELAGALPGGGGRALAGTASGSAGAGGQTERPGGRVPPGGDGIASAAQAHRAAWEHLHRAIRKPTANRTGTAVGRRG